MKRNKADELLAGAIDMHCHGYPEFNLNFPNRYSDEESIQLMIDAGMGGVVLKSHFYPTINSAYYLKQKFPDFNIFSSITLNASSGGCNVWTVEAAYNLGAKVIYLPTWSAKNDQHKQSVCKLIRPYVPHLADFTEEDGFSMVDDKGNVKQNIIDIIQFAKEHSMVLFTGHISPEESIAIAKKAKELNFKKLVMNHPDSGSVKASREQIREFAELGGYVELCTLCVTPMYYRLPINEMIEIINMVGPDQMIIDTDYFFEWSASVPEQIRQVIDILSLKGISDEDIKKMVSVNERKLLDL